jgi:hypothetical protein
MHRDCYAKASTNDQKREVTNRILAETTGCFLKKSTQHQAWTVLDEESCLVKIAQAFRYRKRCGEQDRSPIWIGHLLPIHTYETLCPHDLSESDSSSCCSSDPSIVQVSRPGPTNGQHFEHHYSGQCGHIHGHNGESSTSDDDSLSLLDPHCKNEPLGFTSEELLWALDFSVLPPLVHVHDEMIPASSSSSSNGNRQAATTAHHIPLH